MRVGFIGLGAMGRPMAANLLRAGHDLAVWARRPQAAEPLLRLGATRCDSPAELAARVEVVVTMVTAGADVEQVCFGCEGLLAVPDAPARFDTLIDHSTIAPADARRIAAALAARGIAMLDAPVSGGEQGAREAALAIMVGGPGEVLARVRPLLEAVGRSIVHVGEAGAGQVAKACNQMIMVAAIEAAAEAFRLAAAAGADPARVREALLGGSAGSRVLEVFGARMVARDFAAGVQARLHHKDFAILMNEAHARGLPLPVAAQVWQQLNALMARGWGGADTASLLRVLEGTP